MRRRRTSSAKGLFQFIEQTWLSTLKEQGGALGYAPYADAIARQPSGQYSVPDPRMYGRIMELRSDPNANALMAGAYTRANAGKLGERLGRAPSEGELYIAHFLGPTGASRLIEMAHRQPNTPAAADFSGAARAPIRRSSMTRAAMRAARARSIARWSAATASRAAVQRTRRWPVSCRLLRTPRTPASSAWSA